MDNQVGGKARDEEPDGRQQPSLLLMPGKMTEMVSKTVFYLLVLKKKKKWVFKSVGFFINGRETIEKRL